MTDKEKDIYRAALIGYRARVAELSATISEIEMMLRKPTHSETPVNDALVKVFKMRPKRKFSEAAKKRMAIAQRKRWAKVKGKKAA